MSPEALIFDVDGTLAETEELHRASFNAAFRAHGLPWHWHSGLYRQLLKITGGKERLRHYCDRLGKSAQDVPNADIAALHGLKNQFYAGLMGSGACILRPGVEALIYSARQKGRRLAICTTTSRANVAALLAATLPGDAAACFEVIVAGDEVAAKKPAPDAYLKVLELLALPGSACLAFEDSRNGLQAAMSAGIATIVTPGLYTNAEDFTGAAQILADLRGFAL